MPVTYASSSEIHTALDPLSAAPERCAVFFDLDGTLAPIVTRPEDAGVPAHARRLVERIAGRYALAGVVSGRRAAEARRILGLERITYVGNHGFEVLRPAAAAADPLPALAGKEKLAAGFASAVDPARLDAAGLRIEDKGAIVALHWRGAADEAESELVASEIAAQAEAAGLHTHRGRMVIELRPPIEVGKGDAVAALLAEASLEAAFYAGDDRTDVDAFRALGELVEAGRLQRAVRVAVLSAESPASVAEAADLAVDGPAGFVAVLEALA